MLKKLLLATVLAAPTVFASNVLHTPVSRVVPGSLVELLVVDRQTNQSLPVHVKDGTYYVAGEPGHAYSLIAHNRTTESLLVVLSVDGVNVVTGETAGTKQQGYLLAPHSRTAVTGWRKSMTEVAQFYFTPVADSYAARTDRPGNTGVIGAAVFRSAERPQPRDVEVKRFNAGRPGDSAAADSSNAAARTAAPAMAANEVAAAGISNMAANRNEKLGTGHGEREVSRVESAQFTPEANAAEIIAVRYDSRNNLIQQGIIALPVVQPIKPNPFPNDTFVPDPRR